eukprot:217359-Rhodomonas_salina.1
MLHQTTVPAPEAKTEALSCAATSASRVANLSWVGVAHAAEHQCAKAKAAQATVLAGGQTCRWAGKVSLL